MLQHMLQFLHFWNWLECYNTLILSCHGTCGLGDFPLQSWRLDMSNNRTVGSQRFPIVQLAHPRLGAAGLGQITWFRPGSNCNWGMRMRTQTQIHLRCNWLNRIGGLNRKTEVEWVWRSWMMMVCACGTLRGRLAVAKCCLHGALPYGRSSSFIFGG